MIEFTISAIRLDQKPDSVDLVLTRPTLKAKVQPFHKSLSDDLRAGQEMAQMMKELLPFVTMLEKMESESSMHIVLTDDEYRQIGRPTIHDKITIELIVNRNEEKGKL